VGVLSVCQPTAFPYPPNGAQASNALVGRLLPRVV
jgi:hypothetical protein